eukprot:15364522-Ditylum_brightwellii.AAC.1
MALNADQITAISVATISTTGLGLTAETFLETPYANSINPGTKNELDLFNAATPAILNNKRIDLSTKNSQKKVDMLEKAQMCLKQFGLLMLDNMKRHAHQYYDNDTTTNVVPAPGNMNAAYLTPDTDNMHMPLFFNQEDFTWSKRIGTKVYDGPMLIWTILTLLKPTRNVGVQAEIKTIDSV